MRHSSSSIGLVSMTILAVGLLLTGGRDARAFEDDERSRIVVTSQHRRIDLEPGGTAEIAHVRAMDEVSELAVAEVVGLTVDPSHSASWDLANEADMPFTSGGSASAVMDTRQSAAIHTE